MEQRGDGSPFSDVLIGNYKIFLMTLQVFPEMFGDFLRRSPEGISIFGQRCPERRNVSYHLYFEIRNDAVMNAFYNVPRLRLCPVGSFGRIHPSIPSRCRIVRRTRIYAYVRRKKVSCYMQAPTHVICCRHQQYAFYFIKPHCTLQFQKGTQDVFYGILRTSFNNNACFWNPQF